MSINFVKRALRQLPYTEMKALSAQIADGFTVKVKPDDLADVLASLPLGDERMLETEEVFLGRAFTKKRGGACEIRLKRAGSGWEARAGDFQHTGPTVRGVVSELFDQIAAYEALMAGEGRAL